MPISILLSTPAPSHAAPATLSHLCTQRQLPKPALSERTSPCPLTSRTSLPLRGLETACPPGSLSGLFSVTSKASFFSPLHHPYPAYLCGLNIWRRPGLWPGASSPSHSRLHQWGRGPPTDFPNPPRYCQQTSAGQHQMHRQPPGLPILCRIKHSKP